MFSKPYRVKSNTQMKGSDKKKLKNELKKRFPILTDEDLGAIVPNKDEVLLSKIYTHSGESLLVYTAHRNPILFEFEKERTIYPTVYLLWKYPNLLPSFPTWPPVFKKLANGADLMIPGIVVDHSKGMKAYFDGKLQKGDSVCVNLVTNRAPVAVGSAYLSSEDMYMSGRQGKGVRILHCYGDQLWLSGTQVQIPELEPPEGLEFLKKEEYEDEKGLEDEANDSEDKVDTPEATEENSSQSSQKDITEVIADKCKGMDIQESENREKSSSGESMDEMLVNAFLQAWKTTAKKLELPILTSNFFRLHMMPQCPNNKNLDVKKSSYKKLSKFLFEMQNEGIIKVKELQKGVESITEVNLHHPRIKEFRVVKVEEEQDEESRTMDEPLPCDKPYEAPKIQELYMISAAVLNFMKEIRPGCKKGDGLTAIDVRDIIKEYVAKNNLQSSEQKAKVQIDPVLSSITLNRNENLEYLSWEEIIKRVLSKMSPGYSIQFPNCSPVIKKGKLDPVEISVATRSGNKKVTLIYNLEVYGINNEEFAHKCQVGVAASTSVHDAPNRRPGAKEVLVQGNQTKFVTKLLLNDYKIPRKCVIGGDEKQPKKKGGK